MSKKLKIALSVIGGVVLVVVVLRYAMFKVWTLPEEGWLAASVAPTLWGGDTVLLLTVGSPSRGDLVRCEDPDNPGDWIVGRIVGMPGDVVELQGPTLRIDGVRYDSKEACKEPYFTIVHPDSGAELTLQCSRVEFGPGWHFFGIPKKHKRSDDKKKNVGEGNVFLLSDNRSVHEDSRDFGTLPLESCSERIVFRLWSIDGWADSSRRMDYIR